jgi:hypothetical protein
MLNLKSCARCGGDLFAEDVLGEVELVCLQCGHRTSAPIEQVVQYPIKRRRAPEKIAA